MDLVTIGNTVSYIYSSLLFCFLIKISSEMSICLDLIVINHAMIVISNLRSSDISNIWGQNFKFYLTQHIPTFLQVLTWNWEMVQNSLHAKRNNKINETRFCPDGAIFLNKTRSGHVYLTTLNYARSVIVILHRFSLQKKALSICMKPGWLRFLFSQTVRDLFQFWVIDSPGGFFKIFVRYILANKL
jgi:hypothetical protein